MDHKKPPWKKQLRLIQRLDAFDVEAITAIRDAHATGDYECAGEIAGKHAHFLGILQRYLEVVVPQFEEVEKYAGVPGQEATKRLTEMLTSRQQFLARREERGCRDSTRSSPRSLTAPNPA